MAACCHLQRRPLRSASGCREVAVQPSHISDELSSHALAFVLDGGHRANRGEQRGSIPGCEVGGRASRAQVSEQPMQPVDRSSAFLGQLIASVSEQPQDRCVVLTCHSAKTRAVHGHGGDGDRIQRIGLATVAGVQGRARAARVAGTSTTASPALTSCWASRSPRPDAPSTAQVRSDHVAAHFKRRFSIALFAGTRS